MLVNLHTAKTRDVFIAGHIYLRWHMEPEESKRIVMRFFNESCNKHHLDAIDDVFAVDVRINDEPVGSKSVKSFLNTLWTLFSELHVEVNDQVATENEVSTRRTWQGTLKSDPSKLLKWQEISIVRLEGGKIVEDWVVSENKF